MSCDASRRPRLELPGCLDVDAAHGHGGKAKEVFCRGRALEEEERPNLRKQQSSIWCPTFISCLFLCCPPTTLLPSLDTRHPYICASAFHSGLYVQLLLPKSIVYRRARFFLFFLWSTRLLADHLEEAQSRGAAPLM